MIPALLDRCKAAIISAIYPSPENSPSEASSPPRRHASVDARLDESSLLTLAEAIARRISKDRAATIGQDQIPDPILSQELLAAQVVLLPAFHAFSEILSPFRAVNNVPRDVLSRIFALVGTGQDVVPLSRVCRRWRQIALRSPKLWTSIGDRDLTPMLPAFIERAQGDPLDVSVSIDSGDTRRLERLADLQSASSQLRSFEVTILGSFTDHVKNALSRFRTPAPLLTNLSIRFDYDIKVPAPDSSDGEDAFGLLFDKQLPTLSTLSIKSLRPWSACLSETLTTLTLVSLCMSANDLYPCLKAVPNLTFLALLNIISILSDDYTGSPDPIPLDRLSTLYIHQPRGAHKHFVHLMSRLQIPRPSLACILMGECNTLDEDFTINLTQPARLSYALTRLVLEMDGEPATKFYLHGVHDDATFVLSICLPTSAIPLMFSAGPDNIPTTTISLGSLSADTSHTTEFILRASSSSNGGGGVGAAEIQTISTENLTHIFRHLPALETLVVTGTPLDNVVSALAALRDELHAPALPRLRSLYIRGIGGVGVEAEAAAVLALARFVGQRLEPDLLEPRVVCPASLKTSLGPRFRDVEAIEDLGASDFPRPLMVPMAMQEFLKANLERDEWDWLMERNRWNWN